MSQIDLQKLTKKNQEFIHIATQQFIKDGKTDAEIKAIFEEVIPKILEEQAKGTTARSLYGAPTHWAHSFTVKEQYEKEHPKENDDPKLMIMDSALFITSLFALVSSLTNFFSTDQAIGYGLITLLLVGLVGGVAFYLMYYFVYSIMVQIQIVASALLSGNQSSSSSLLCFSGWLSSSQQASYQQLSIQSLLHCLWLS